MDYSKLTLEEIEREWDTQMVYVCIGTQDKAIINGLAEEVRKRNEHRLIEQFQRDVIEAYASRY